MSQRPAPRNSQSKAAQRRQEQAERIERILSEVVRAPELHEIRHHGSLAGPVDPIYPPRGLAGEEWDRA